MLSQLTLSALASSLVFRSELVQAAPSPSTLFKLEGRTVMALSTSQIAAYKPVSQYAGAVFCDPALTLSWTCGERCAANPSFKPVATGGNGGSVQQWMVGYDPTLDTVIVAHQGTNPDEFASILTDADFFLDTFDTALFPTFTTVIKGHNGFVEAQAETAPEVLAAVSKALTQFSTKHVTITGHSLGAAIALIDAVYLPLHLPADTIFTTTIYGAPRVGNQAFADYVDAHVTNFSRVNNKKDIVPIVPGRFLGFHHPAGEVHISSTGSWDRCSGQDSTDKACSTGLVSNVFVGETDDHVGPYDGVYIGYC